MRYVHFQKLICRCIPILSIPQAGTEKPCAAFLDQRFKRTSAIAPIIRYKPPLFGSNHAPFLIGRRYAALEPHVRQLDNCAQDADMIYFQEMMAPAGFVIVRAQQVFRMWT